MKRLFWALAIVAALIAAFLAGRVSNAPRVDGSGLSPPAVDANAVVPDAATSPAASPTTGSRATSSTLSGTATPGDVAAPVSASSGSRSPAPVGPQPLVQDDLPKLEKAETMMGADGGTTRDLLDLADAEEQDDGARRLETMIAQAIQRHGGGYTDLRMAAPHCTRSLCILRAVGAGETQNPRSNWQRLSGRIMSEPWWREAFDDMRSMVTTDGGDTVYITLFIRCEPGKCRFGKTGQQ